MQAFTLAQLILCLQAYAWAWVPCTPDQYYWYIILARREITNVIQVDWNHCKLNFISTQYVHTGTPLCFCQKEPEVEITEVMNITAISYRPYHCLNRSQPWCNISFGDLKKTRLMWKCSMHTLILSKLYKKTNKQRNKLRINITDKN